MFELLFELLYSDFVLYIGYFDINPDSCLSLSLHSVIKANNPLLWHSSPFSVRL
jgi:hypothetical protein